VSVVAVGAGAVWAVNPDLSVSRIDPATGAILARIGLPDAQAVASGREGVWVVRASSSVTRIDLRTNRPAQTIKLAASSLAGIALGAGYVWVTDPADGTVWQIDPGPPAITRTISVGVGVSGVAFGGGAVWAANFIAGTASRIDPKTSAVTAAVRIPGSPQGVAVGGGLAWVTLAGGTRKGSLPASACAPLESGGHKPQLLIATDLPLQGPGGAVAHSLADAVRLVLRAHGFRAGRYSVGYQSCDDSTAQSGGFDFFKCGSNAKAYAQASQLVALIGTYNSFCAYVELPIVNRATGGALPMVSPSDTNVGLTRPGPGAPRDQFTTLYPTGVRNFLRLAAPDDVQGAGDAVLAHQLGLRRVYVLNDGTPYGQAVAAGFMHAASRLGLPIAGSGIWSPTRRGYTGLATRVAASRADGVFLGAADPMNGGRAVKALRARLGRRVTLIGPDGFLRVPDLLKVAGPAAVGMYVSIAGVTTGALGPAGRSFVRRLAAMEPGGTIPSGTYAPQAAQAAEVVLAAIARSDGTRASVLRELHATHVQGGILGSFRFDGNGDMTSTPVAIFRVTGGRGDPSLISDFQGSVGDRVVTVPLSLLR
jgi:branched-chain amino acid transport system substrate-binding protein